MKPTLAALLFFFNLPFSHAQKDTTIHLPILNITSTRLSCNSGLRQISIDSSLKTIHAQHSLSDLLTENTAIFLKNYGPGGLSTQSLRGGSSYQTAILWNGFSLASPLHGLTDLSLENNFFFNDINIQFGGTSALWGSGAVSGNIQLNNKPFFNSGLTVDAGTSVASYNSLSARAGVSYGNSLYSGTVKFATRKSENDYDYIDENTNTKKKQAHAGFTQYGIMNDNYFRTGKNSIFSLKAWYSFSSRDIPPALMQVNSNSTQKDINTRLSAEWKTIFGTNEIDIRTACFIEQVDYDDDLLTQPSLNRARSSISEITFHRDITENHHLHLGINLNYSEADSSSNLGAITLSRQAIFALYKFNTSNDRFELSLSARREFSSLEDPSLIYSAGSDYEALPFLILRAAYSTVYRNPTLNDLYWKPGGNVNLRPENGFSTEAGFALDVMKIMKRAKENYGSSLLLNFTGYYKSIDDWIIWYPSSSALWTPQNLSLVRSRGLECIADYKYSTAKFSFGISGEYFYTKSTNEKTLLANDASLHCQLIYVPVHRYNLKLFTHYKSISLHYNHSYTGIRYTSTDNLSSLPSYSIDHMEIDKTFALKNSSLRIFLRVNNIFNTSYQSVENLPMPLRNYETGISFLFRKNKS